jgi:hypothetical protein
MPTRTHTQRTAKGQRARLGWPKSMTPVTGISPFPRDELNRLWLVGEGLGPIARSLDYLSKAVELRPGEIVPCRFGHWSQGAPDSWLLP